MKYATRYFGANAESLFRSKLASQDLLAMIQQTNIKTGYKGQRSLNAELRKTLKRVAQSTWTFEAPSDFDQDPDFSDELGFSHERGFNVEILRDGTMKPKQKKNGRKTVDARCKKEGIDLEIEFGNFSSPYRDYMKFHRHYNNGVIDLAVIVAPVSSLSTCMGEALSSFERICTELYGDYRDNPPGHCPIVVIGLFPYDEEGNCLIDFDSVESLHELQETRKRKAEDKH